MTAPAIGILALQGAFAKHAEMLKRLGVQAKEIRYPQDLDFCDGLIIPGGESTTIMKQLERIAFIDPIKRFSQSHPVFGTCAGLILISQTILNDRMKPLGLLDISVERNAFGRQAESFHVEIEFRSQGKSRPIPAFFIRAPRIRECASSVQILAEYEGEPVLVQQGIHLGASFHPELSENTTVHSYFLSIVKNHGINKN